MKNGQKVLHAVEKYENFGFIVEASSMEHRLFYWRAIYEVFCGGVGL